MSLLIPFPFGWLLNKKAARVEVNTECAKNVIPLVHYITLYERYHFFGPPYIWLAFLHCVGIVLHPWPFVSDMTTFIRTRMAVGGGGGGGSHSGGVLSGGSGIPLSYADKGTPMIYSDNEGLLYKGWVFSVCITWMWNAGRWELYGVAAISSWRSNRDASGELCFC